MRSILLLLAGAAAAVAVPAQLRFADLDAADEGRDAEQGFRLISTSESEAHWMSEDEILGLIRQQIHFMDITDQDIESVASLAPPKTFTPPKEISHQDIVDPLASNVSVAHLTSWLTEFTSFKTRYYQSASGAESAQWIYDQAREVAEDADKKVKVSISKFEHTWAQFSVLVRVEAEEEAKGDDEEDLPIVVISAHQDSINQWNPWWGRSPGADDDGSGSVTIFEAYRILITSGFVPRRPIEFHWYSAEEGGLLGSQKVVAKYKADGVAVAGVFHADMTGYQPPEKDEFIGVATDFTDIALTSFLRQLVDVYGVEGIRWIDTKCGYACSDHASWTKAGYQSTFTFEAEFDDHSPYIHTTNDDVSHISFPHIAKFSRVALAFAVEMSLAK
ncbi:hypothetical protein HK101_011704 [Irineochytrium annulatum]|nr:hypothetical protein HK101_011704 [Irineochytrium annulatum]